MNSRDYWLKREEEALKHRITDEQEYQKEIQRIYQNMLDACQKEIESFYAKYAKAEGITISEAKKRVSKHDVKAFERKAAKYVKDKDFSKKANEELRLYNATMRINRMEMLKANIGLETIAGHDELEKFMAGILKGRTEDELKRQAGILGKTVLNNAAKANAIVNGSFKVAKVGDRSTFSDRIWQYQDNMRQDLGKLLQQGLIQGKNPRAITKDLRQYWYGKDPKTGGGAEYCMERLMRTELARVQTEAQKQSFIRNGFEHYEFIVNTGCCPICLGLDGKHFDVAKMMPGENAPPMHPNCRCSTAAWEDDEEYEAWLDYLESGGTTEDWKKKTAAEEKQAGERLKNVRRHLENSEKGGKIKLGFQFFARSSKDYKTIELPKQEYAHVMSELATHLTAAQRKQKVVTKAIGKYIYTIENNGFGNYRVIGKEAIDNDIFDWWED
jgi:SPP1 gp7 family putative phage head morphogenesis protein